MKTASSSLETVVCSDFFRSLVLFPVPQFNFSVFASSVRISINFCEMSSQIESKMLHSCFFSSFFSCLLVHHRSIITQTMVLDGGFEHIQFESIAIISARYLLDVDSMITNYLFYFSDVPDAPERPLITSFTSRSMNLSWAHSQEPRNAPVTHFLIETRYVRCSQVSLKINKLSQDMRIGSVIINTRQSQPHSSSTHAKKGNSIKKVANLIESAIWLWRVIQYFLFLIHIRVLARSANSIFPSSKMWSAIPADK